MQAPFDALDAAKLDEMVTVCACLRLRKASRIVTQLFDQALRPSGLRSTQLPVLVTLGSRSSTMIMHPAEELLMDRTSLTRLLKPLAIQGLIFISPGGDRRTRRVSLTDRGMDAVAKAMPLWATAQARVTKELGPQLSDGLQRILLAVQQAAQR